LKETYDTLRRISVTLVDLWASAEMSKIETLRPCDACGVRVPASKGHETSGGTFFCPTCFSTPAMQSHTAPRRCSVCDQIVARTDCHKDHTGKYICLNCDKRRLHQSPQRQVRRVSRLLIRFALAGLITALVAIVVAWIFVFVLDRAAEPPTLN
jgi:hypothetical protein